MDQSSDRLLVPPSANEHIQGNLNAPIVLVEYGDYQCPDCGSAHGIIRALQLQFGDRLCFVYRHFPQTQLHSQAQRAAEAAEAAAIQGQFWQMHDILFEHQQELGNGFLVEYANMLNLDISQFLKDIAKRRHTDRINRDIENGLRNGITRTPTLFINQFRYTDCWTIENLLAVISDLCH